MELWDLAPPRFPMLAVRPSEQTDAMHAGVQPAPLVASAAEALVGADTADRVMAPLPLELRALLWSDDAYHVNPYVAKLVLPIVTPHVRCIMHDIPCVVCSVFRDMDSSLLVIQYTIYAMQHSRCDNVTDPTCAWLGLAALEYVTSNMNEGVLMLLAYNVERLRMCITQTHECV